MYSTVRERQTEHKDLIWQVFEIRHYDTSKIWLSVNFPGRKFKKYLFDWPNTGIWFPFL